MKDKMRLFVAMILVVGIIAGADAFAIGSSSAFNLEPGESVEDFVRIMNRGKSSNDIVVDVSVDDGEEFVTLIDGRRFDVPAGQVASVKVRVSVPEGTEAGSYPVVLSFNPVSGGVSEGGTVDIAYGYSKKFEINVNGKVGDVEENVLTTPKFESEERKSLFDRIIEWISELFNG